jgi:hypothetical protein
VRWTRSPQPDRGTSPPDLLRTLGGHCIIVRRRLIHGLTIYRYDTIRVYYGLQVKEIDCRISLQCTCELPSRNSKHRVLLIFSTSFLEILVVDFSKSRSRMHIIVKLYTDNKISRPLDLDERLLLPQHVYSSIASTTIARSDDDNACEHIGGPTPTLAFSVDLSYVLGGFAHREQV